MGIYLPKDKLLIVFNRQEKCGLGPRKSPVKFILCFRINWKRGKNGNRNKIGKGHYKEIKKFKDEGNLWNYP